MVGLFRQNGDYYHIREAFREKQTEKVILCSKAFNHSNLVEKQTFFGKNSQNQILAE